ncbi:hypothetical protein [Clostridium pasteurianum]|uniref:hypothetical protein n=1 Tax=Clostridium pasteurianum TaxID=1501 RepID=UPI003C12FE81
MAGMACVNASLGECHYIVHKIGCANSIQHGVYNAMHLTEVIEMRGTDNAVKQTAFPQYEYP